MRLKPQMQMIAAEARFVGILLAISGALASVEQRPLMALDQPLNCHEQCGESLTAFCLPVSDKSASIDVGKGLQELFNTLHHFEPNAVLTSGDLQRMFALSDDPCRRGDTSIISGVLSNDGPVPCRVATTIGGDFGGVDLEAAILVPRTLRAKLSQSDTEIVVSFLGEAFRSRPVLDIGNDLLNADWGGGIREVFFRASSTIVATESGCIKYIY